jgi:hypothetical protein
MTETVFHSSPLTSVTSATGRSIALSDGTMLTRENPRWSFRVFTATVWSDHLALAMAARWAWAAARASPFVIGSTATTFQVAGSTMTFQNVSFHTVQTESCSLPCRS